MNQNPGRAPGTFGSGLGELRTPIEVAVSEARDRLVVASLNSGSLQVFRLGTTVGGPAVNPASLMPTVFQPACPHPGSRACPRRPP
ncbi:MAG: hypothetical protein GY856_49590 [bacterium]|nr:hypothetical protein [bacterium]